MKDLHWIMIQLAAITLLLAVIAGELAAVISRIG